MPEWAMQIIGPVAGGAVSGLLFIGGIRAEMRAIGEKVADVATTARRAHVRIDDHVDRHHVGVKHA